MRQEIAYRAYELKDKLHNWSRSFLKKIASFKPVSNDFKELAKSEDSIASEFKHKNSSLKIFNVNDSNSKLTNLSLTVKLPETNEKIPGTAHFFEHMAMTNKVKDLKKDIMTWAEENGVECNAFTSAKEMSFIFNSPDEKIQPIVKFLSSLYEKDPWDYDPKIVEGERQAIQGERIGYENRPFMKISRQVSSFLKGARHYANKNILGKEEDINKIHPNDLENVRKTFNSAESTLKIYGPNSKLVDSIIHNSFKDVEAKKEKTAKLEIDYEKEAEKGSKKVFKHHEISDAQSLVYYPNKELLRELNLSKIEKRKITNFIWLSILMGEDSRLRKVFNKEKINHGLSLMNYDHENKGLVSITTMLTDKKLFSKIENIIEKEFKKIAEEGLKLDELNSIKNILGNSFEYTKENLAANYMQAIDIAENLEEKDWQQFTNKESLKYLQDITKDETSLNEFNNKLKAFVDAYLINGKKKIFEQHNESVKNKNTLPVNSTNLIQTSSSSVAHDRRPLVEFKNKHRLARMPWDKVSFKKLDDKTFLVDDKDSNIVRLRVFNPSALMTMINPQILASGDKERIRVEANRMSQLASLALGLFNATQGAKEEYNPEHLASKLKKLGTNIHLDAGSKTINFSISGIKKNIKETSEIFNEIISDPAILSSDKEVQARVKKEFDESVENVIRSLKESMDDRDSIVMKEFQNLIFKDQPEMQCLDPKEEIEILKSLSLDEVKDFFKKYVIFDDQMKIITNNSSLEAGLESSEIQKQLKKINNNDKRNSKTPELRKLQATNIPKSQQVTMNLGLDKVGSKITLGNLTEDLSNLSDEDRKLLSMTMKILGSSGLHSRLGGKLRENGIYHWGMHFSLPDNSLGSVEVPQEMFYLSCDCKPEDTYKINKLIKDTLLEYLQEGPLQEEIERIQNKDNLVLDNLLTKVHGRMQFFEQVLLKNRAPRKMLNIANRFYDAKRAKELLKMVIKPDNFIEVIDTPKVLSPSVAASRPVPA